MGGDGFDERRRAMTAYALAIKEYRDAAGTGYTPHERVLLLIGFAAGWDMLRYVLDRIATRTHED